MKLLLQLRGLPEGGETKFRKVAVLIGLGCVSLVLIFGDVFISRFLLVGGVVGVGLMYGREVARRRLSGGLYKWLRRGVIGAVLVGIGSFFTVEYKIFSFKAETEAKTDYVLVLGAGLKHGDRLGEVLVSRLERGLELMRARPGGKIIVSGGQGADETRTEASAMREYLMARGVEASRILVEDKSTTTVQNIEFTKKLLMAEQPGGIPSLSLVTSEFHLYRASELANREGLRVYSFAARTPSRELMNYAIREYFAVVKNWVMRGN